MNYRLNTQLMLSIVLALSTSGCSTLSNGSGYLSSAVNIISGPYAKFPQSQAPHTLLRKPVGDGRMSSEYGYRLSPSGLPLPKKHSGVDYSAAKGTAVLAAGHGVVVGKRRSPSYGNVLTIEHENGFKTRYAHLDSFSGTVEIGTRVKRSQAIGTVGSTGRSTGPHLHYELIYQGEKVNPIF